MLLCPSPTRASSADDVVRVARNREPGVTIEQIAKDLRCSPDDAAEVAALVPISTRAPSPASSVERPRPGAAEAESDPARAGERGPAPGGGVSVAGQPAGKRFYPLVHRARRRRIPVAVTCRVLKLSGQPLLPVAGNPIIASETGGRRIGQRHLRRPRRRSGVGHRLLDQAGDAGEACRTGPRGGSRRATAGGPRSARSGVATARAGRRSTRRSLRGDRRGRAVRHEFAADGPNQSLAHRHHRTSNGGGKALPLRDQGRVSNRIVGYSIDSRMKSSLAGPRCATRSRSRSPAGTVCHTDRGGQFRAKRTQRLLAINDLVGSMGRSPRAGDNAAMESFFSLLQKNVLNPPFVDHPRTTAHRDRDLDRTHLPSPPPTSRPRPFDPGRIRGHHEHASRTGCVTTTCHVLVQQSPTLRDGYVDRLTGRILLGVLLCVS